MLFIPELNGVGDSRQAFGAVEMFWAERLRKQTPTHDHNAYSERMI